jgi:hypothetical protein
MRIFYCSSVGVRVGGSGTLVVLNLERKHESGRREGDGGGDSRLVLLELSRENTGDLAGAKPLTSASSHVRASQPGVRIEVPVFQGGRLSLDFAPTVLRDAAA